MNQLFEKLFKVLRLVSVCRIKNGQLLVLEVCPQKPYKQNFLCCKTVCRLQSTQNFSSSVSVKPKRRERARELDSHFVKIKMYMFYDLQYMGHECNFNPLPYTSHDSHGCCY